MALGTPGDLRAEMTDVPSPSPRVLIVIGALDRGGAEGQMVEFVRASHPGHALCSVVCLIRAGDRAGEAGDVGASVAVLGLRRGPLAPLGAVASGLRGVVRLIRILRRERPDIVYCLMGGAQLIALPVAAVAARGALRVAGLRAPHGDDRLPFHTDWLRDRVLTLAHGAIANSAASIPTWENAQPSLRGRIHLVANGVAPEAAPVSERSEGDTVTIVCVASLVPRKDHRLLLEAVARLPSEPSWRLELIGEGQLQRTIEQDVSARGLSDRVSMLGQRADVRALVARADIVVLSSDSEGTPNALLEAMASGVPVVATRVGGVQDLVGEDAGLLVPYGDAAALAEALSRLIRDPSLRSTVGAAGAARVAEHHSIDRMRDRTLAAFAVIEASASRAR